MPAASRMRHNTRNGVMDSPEIIEQSSLVFSAFIKTRKLFKSRS